jgi:hypothetical protein
VHTILADLTGDGPEVEVDVEVAPLWLSYSKGLNSFSERQGDVDAMM